MKVTVLLADFAEAINGKLYIMGGGWSMTGPNPCPSAIAGKIEVPWTETNRKHNLKVELLDEDYHPVMLPTQNGASPLIIGGDFEVGRPPGLLPGTPIDVPFAFNIGPLPLDPGRRYVWKVSINGTTEDTWRATFNTRPVAPNPTTH